MLTSLHFLSPDTLFQLAMVYFIAEKFEGLVIIQRILLDMKHPVAMFNFTRVFSVCFESDSLSYQADIINGMVDEYKSGSEMMFDRENNKKRRVLPTDSIASIPWVTFLPEDTPLLEQYSVDMLVTLADSLVTTPPVPPASSVQHTHTVSMDLTSFSRSGLVPACLTVLAEHALPPVATLNMSHNHFFSFPLVILDISSLVRLDLSWNSLSSMPSGVDKLLHLQVLNISHNQFIYFPSSVLKLKASLLELYLQDNKLEEIRNDFLKLSHLQVLDVSNNRLKTVPSQLSSHMKLKFFRFSGNPVFDLFASQPPQHLLHGHAPGVLKFSTTSSVRLNNKNSKTNNKGRRSQKNKRKR
jgi:hypothetical protein